MLRTLSSGGLSESEWLVPCSCQNENSRMVHCLKQHLMNELLYQLKFYDDILMKFYDDILYVVNDVEAALRYLLISHEDSSVLKIVGSGKGHSIK